MRSDLIRRGVLLAPASYWVASQPLRDANCNGCGTAGWKGELIPDTVYGLSIADACNIHDWMYAKGITEDDRGEADATFLANMLAIVEQAAKASVVAWLMAPFRRRRCLLYFEAVRQFGSDPFRQAELIGVDDERDTDQWSGLTWV